MADRCCVICGGDEAQNDLLVQAPCRIHWVCPDDIASFFERATNNESLFPPKCCDQMFILDDFEDHVPFDTAWAYRLKEQGEYATLPKFRVYCASKSCGKFLHPSNHVADPQTKVMYAVCENADCGKTTCTTCRIVLEKGVQNHACKKTENEEKFEKIVNEEGYQTCNICGSTIELAEACNHVTCSCGHSFCYICGKDWTGLHSCPHYSRPQYDKDGYNQDGYHRETGLNREGLTRRQFLIRQGGGDPDDERADDDWDEEEDIDWEVLQHLTPEQRAAVNGLGEQDRDDVLDQLRIDLFEQHGITFVGASPPQDDPGSGDEGNEENENDEEGIQESDEDSDADADGETDEEIVVDEGYVVEVNHVEDHSPTLPNRPTGNESLEDYGEEVGEVEENHDDEETDDDEASIVDIWGTQLVGVTATVALNRDSTGAQDQGTINQDLSIMAIRIINSNRNESEAVALFNALLTDQVETAVHTQFNDRTQRPTSLRVRLETFFNNHNTANSARTTTEPQADVNLSTRNGEGSSSSNVQHPSSRRHSF